jgi:hypothetical protein
VIKGTVSHWPEGGSKDSAKQLAPGSYFMIPGKMKHISSCAAGSDCLMGVFQKGKMDAIMLDAPKPAK